MKSIGNNILLSVAQMREADRLAIEGGIPGIVLMENAGAGVVREIKKHWPPRPVVVLCGPGNNGGDGFVVARLLAESGWQVKVGLLGERDKLKGEAAHHSRLWKGSVEPLSPGMLQGAALVVVAIFGAGLARAIEGVALDTLNAVRKMGMPVVAVDIPSGVMGDTGESLGAIPARLTVTFFRKKPGHLLLPGRDLCGEVVVIDIGIRQETLEKIKPDTYENTPELWLHALPKPGADANKYSRGHALVYGGYPMTGASRLAAHAAARAGAGYVTLACPEEAFAINAEALDSVVVKAFADDKELGKILENKHLAGLLIGPGAGVNDETKRRVLAMLALRQPVVLDADAISVFRDDVKTLKKSIQSPCVMTPHEGEFSRVFHVTGDKLTRACAAAKESGAVIVLKGSDTVIASPDGRAAINANAPATLATAGSGDVLSGIITGLMAQGMDAFLAACAGVWLHGEAAHLFGPGLIADDIADMLPKVFSKL